MKRIILSLGVLMVLSQNIFATSDAEYDKLIANAKTEQIKQGHRCDKATLNHKYTSDVNICLKALELDLKANASKSYIAIDYLNSGVLYKYHEKNYIKAYEYYMKSAKLGDTDAQRNLDNLCRAHSWACK